MSKEDKIKLNDITNIQNYNFVYYNFKLDFYSDTGGPDYNIYINTPAPSSPHYYNINLNVSTSPGRYYGNTIHISNIHMYPGSQYVLLVNDQSYFNVLGLGSGFIDSSRIKYNTSANTTIPTTSFDIANLKNTDYSKFTKAYLFEPSDHIFEFNILYDYTVEYKLSESSTILDITFLVIE